MLNKFVNQGCDCRLERANSRGFPNAVALLLLLALGPGCASESVSSADEESLSEVNEPLWLGTGATLWPNGYVNVCFQGFDSAQRATIRSTVENGWERAAAINFEGWGNCPIIDAATTNLLVVAIEAVPGATGQSTHCADQNTSTCGGALGRAPAGSYNRVRFASGSPVSFTVLHEFGHALGFEHQTQSDTGCNQRTSGGTSLQNEQDIDSVMIAFHPCNPSVTKLSSWDILGARKAYGVKPHGSIVSRNALCLNINGGVTTLGANIIGWACLNPNPWNSNWSRSDGNYLLSTSISGTQRCLNVQGGVVGFRFHQPHLLELRRHLDE